MRLSLILKQVNNCMQDYYRSYPLGSQSDFYWYLGKHYGTQLFVSDEGKLLNTYEIVDQYKHDIFLLKYSS